MIIRNEELELNKFLTESMKSYDLTNFLIPLWDTIFEIVQDEEEVEIFDNLLVNTMDLECMNEQQAAGIFRILFQCMERDQNLINLKKTQKHIHPIVLRYENMVKIKFRFSTAFEQIRAEWKVRNEELITKFLNDFKIEAHEV